MDIEFLIPSQNVIRSLTASSIIYLRTKNCMRSLHELEFISLILMVPNGLPLTSVCIFVRDHDGLLMDVVARQ